MTEESLGKILRSARESAEITVDDAVYRARLPRAVVEALEADDFGFFTSPLYARSFLRQYGDYLNLDVSQWIEDLVPTTLIDSEAVESFIDLSETDSAPVIREKPKEKSSGGGAMAAVWMALITGGLVFGGMEVYKRLDDQLSPPAPTAPPAPPIQQAAAPEPAPAPQDAAETEEKSVATAQPEPPKRAIIVEE
ncbi:helix-turn-helix domain-containing protein [Akkermansiaceae bacterium]|nr:helix-turn-helix domain-containing protein [Akkermansiaceae bacterium]